MTHKTTPRTVRDDLEEKLIAADMVELAPGLQHAVDDAGLQELADSIRIVGQLHPVHVRDVGGERLQIISGRRRWMACKMLGQDVRCRVHEQCADEEADRIRVIENQHRQDPSAYETAISLRRLKNTRGWTQEVLAAELGMGIGRVKEYLSIFNGSDRLLDAMRKERLSISMAVELMRLERSIGEPAARGAIQRAVRGEISVREIRSKRSAKPKRQVRAERCPWETLAKRAQKLAKEKPALARKSLPKLASALRQIAASLGKAPTDTAV